MKKQKIITKVLDFGDYRAINIGLSEKTAVKHENMSKSLDKCF